MTRFLRTAPPRRLLAALAGAVALVAAGTAIAVAATSGGPVARTRPLAQALQAALAARPVAGITARITFTNHLIDSADLQGSDPLLSGATGRLWLGADRMRLELQTDGGSGDAELVVNGRSLWAFDPATNTVYRGLLPAARSYGGTERAGSERVPTVAAISRALGRLARHLSLSQAIGTDVAGQAAYRVRVSPALAGGELDSVQLAWDALRGVPLAIGVYAKGSPDPVLALRADQISYGKVSPADFSTAAPAGARVVDLTPERATSHRGGTRPRERRARPVSGVSQVAARLPFALDAPASLASRPRSSVRLIHVGAHPAALVTYGRDLNGLALIEAPAAAGRGPSVAAPRGDHAGLTLPSVGLAGGITAQELDTALGSVVHFQRGGVSFTILGSVGRAVVDQAAREL